MKKNPSFKTSVNIKFDIGNKEFLDRYLPTPSHAESLIGLSTGFVNERANSSHIMIGPYGSGKSLIASIMASIVSKSVSRDTVNQLIYKFEKVHRDIYTVLTQLHKKETQFIPVALSGYEGSFSEAIINAVNRELSRRNIDDNLSSDKETVTTIIRKWKNDFYHTYKDFSNLVQKERGYTVKKWLEIFERNSTRELSWFKNVYPQFTAGAEYKVDNSKLFVEKMEKLIKILERENIGIFIVYDEFGRFLQTLKSEDVYKTMQDIQDLAEITTRSKGLMHLLLVSHKSMGQYMLSFNEDYKSEFQRIEKRFNTYFVESDTATYYRIAEQYTSKIASSSLFAVNDYANSVEEIRKFNLFDELNQQEVEKVIVEGAYPIHPVALYLLPKISKVFGQNERTLFTFLESKDTGGLINHLSKSDRYYYAHNLFNFFFSQNQKDNYDDNTFKSFYLYKKITNKLVDNEVNKGLHQILKFITLWELSNSNAVYKLDSELIAFATGIAADEVNLILEIATTNKFVRYNRITQVWELHEGSAVVLDELLNDNKKEIKLSSETRISFLESLIKKQYFLANEYNDKKSMTRFMKVKLVKTDDVLKGNLITRDSEMLDSDGVIYFVLLDSLSNFHEVLEMTKKIKCTNVMFSIIQQEYSTVQTLVDKELVVASLLNNKKTLSEYTLLEEELLVLQEELLYEISKYLNRYVRFSSDNLWISAGEVIHLYDEIDLENKISKVMEYKYNKTPLILNEAINRIHVKGVQLKALYRVMSGVLNDLDEEHLGIEGQGPDYLTYATVIKNNNINLKNLNDIRDSYLKELRNQLLDEIITNPIGDLKQLVDIMTKPPFGIRKPLIPLLLIVLLRDKWDQIMFYRNDMFVPAIEAEKVYSMLGEFEDYQYEFHQYSEDLLLFMADIEILVKDNISDQVKDRTLLIKACSGLLNWQRQLPRVTQITKHLSDRETELRDLIKRTEISPLDSMKKIHKLFDGSSNSLEKVMKSMHNFYGRFVINVTDQVLKTINADSFDKKDIVLQEINTEVISNNRLLNSLSNSQNVNQFVDEYIGTSMKNWSDNTLDLYEQQLKNDFESIGKTNEGNELHADTIQLNYNNKYKRIDTVELSTKSQTIFNNVDRMLKNAGRTVSKKELNYIMFKLVDKYLE